MDGPRRPVVLIGLRCAGKTSVGRRVSELSGRPFADLDRELEAEWERRTGREVRAGELLAELGEPAFRDLEEAVLHSLLGRDDGPVLAAGGGTVERAACRALLARCRCVWLRADPAVLAARLEADPTPRPALGGGSATDELSDLAQQRERWYVELAWRVVESGEAEVEEVAREVFETLGAG
ncbi:MAG: shikimate kinase [Planctomycetota bacterium]|jgi:shikimate kinase|nr:shikimate kinase [Planctomycetota bacterium]MDP6763576.1 shikimate kinase [Planctomycetota bacterium]MDP6988209.1 shikimate kinase [Planctomycetota bacterium]